MRAAFKRLLLGGVALGLWLGGTAAKAAGPEATITDSGQGNDATIDQAGNSWAGANPTEATITQHGTASGNQASVNQSGSKRNVATITQRGDDDTATIAQTNNAPGAGANPTDATINQNNTNNLANLATIEQVANGPQVDATITQNNTQGSTATVRQGLAAGNTDRVDARIVQRLGSDNLAETIQDGSRLDSDIVQKGSDNQAFVTQNVVTTAPLTTSAITQEGDGNLAEVEQTGLHVTSAIEQLGNGNQAEVSQSGDTNASEIIQDGDLHTAAVTQSNDDNTSAITQTGSENEATVAQSRDLGSVEVTQSDTLNQALVTQSGNDNARAFVTQSGTDGTATVLQ